MPRRTIIEDATVAVFRTASEGPLDLRDADRRKLERIRWKLINQRKAMERTMHPMAEIAYATAIGRVMEEPGASPPSYILSLRTHSGGEIEQALLRARPDLVGVKIGLTGEGLPASPADPVLPTEDFGPTLDDLASILNQISKETN